MNDEIRELLDHLAVCKDHLENGEWRRWSYWKSEFDSTALKLAEAWANETADVAE